MVTEYGTMNTEEEMLAMVDEMEEDQLREVLLDEGVQAAALPADADGMRDHLRMITYCQYQEYTSVDWSEELHPGVRLRQLRELRAQGEVDDETLVWSEDLGSDWVPLGELLRDLYGGTDVAASPAAKARQG